MGIGLRKGLGKFGRSKAPLNFTMKKKHPRSTPCGEDPGSHLSWDTAITESQNHSSSNKVWDQDTQEPAWNMHVMKILQNAGKKIYLGMWELCKSERISCQTSKLTHVISWSLLRFVEKYKRWFQFQYPIHINCWKNPTCKECKDDVNLKEYLTIQACKSMVLLRFMWLMGNFMLCLQEMWWWSKSNGISYQTPIMKSWNCFQNRNPKIWKV